MAASSLPVTSAGTTLGISASLPASLTTSAYAALTFTNVGEVTDGGSIGRTYNIVNHNPLATRGTVKLKGSFDDGTVQLQVAYAPGDAGQVLVQTALDDDDFCSFAMTLQNGTIVYFQAQVTSAPINVGGVDTVTSITVNLAVKSGSIKIKHPA